MFYQDTASEPAHRAKLDHPLAELVSIPTKPQIIEYHEMSKLDQYILSKYNGQIILMETLKRVKDTVWAHIRGNSSTQLGGEKGARPREPVSSM